MNIIEGTPTLYAHLDYTIVETLIQTHTDSSENTCVKQRKNLLMAEKDKVSL